MAGNSDLQILIQAILTKDSIPTIEKQLNELKTKYGNNIISINIDSNILSTLQSFTKAMENFKAVTASQISVNNNVTESVKKEAQAVNELTAAQAKYNVEKQKTTTAADNSYQKVSTTSGTKFDNTTKTQILYPNGGTADQATVQNVDYAGLANKNFVESEKVRVAKEKADAEHLKQTRANLLQEENEWNSFVSNTEKSYQKYIDVTGKSLLQEEKDLASFVTQTEQSYNKLNAATNKGLLQEENEYKSFIAKQEANYQKYLSAQLKLGDNVGAIPKANLNWQEAENYTKSLTGMETELTKITPSINAAGEKVQILNTRVIEGGKYHREYTTTLNEATGQAHMFANGLTDVSNRQLGFVEALKSAIVRLPTFMLAGLAIRESFGFFTDAIKYVNEFNATLTQISTAVNYNQAKVQELGKSYQQLAIQLGATSKEVASGALEFYRQGLGDEQVLSRLKTTTEYSKISGLQFVQSADLLTAASTSMKVDVGKVADVFTLLGDKTATSKHMCSLAS